MASIVLGNKSSFDRNTLIHRLLYWFESFVVYGMFQVTWTTFKFNRKQLGTVSAYGMWLWLIALLMCTLK